MTRNILIGTLVIALGGAGFAMAEGRQDRGASFETLDQNGDGSITQAEMDAIAAERFATRDENNDGALSKDELLKGASARAERRVERMLDRLDANDDGQLTQAELSERPGRGRLFERLDANEDGAISQAEFDEARGKMRKNRRQGG